MYANAQILAQHDGDQTSGRTYYYLHDRLGSVRIIIDAAASVANSYTYEPFGAEITAECSETIENPFKFTGQYLDSETHQYYLRARQYDPKLMRFTARDPIFGDFQESLTFHKYLYCLNDPLNKSDPTGNAYVDLNFSHSFGGISSGFMGGLTFTGGTMVEFSESGISPYLYAGAGYTLSAFGGPTTTLTASFADVVPGLSIALTVISPMGDVLQLGVSPGEHPLEWARDLFSEGCPMLDAYWLEFGTKDPRARLPKNIPGIGPVDPGIMEWLNPRRGPLDWKNASVSLTAFWVFDTGISIFDGQEALLEKAIGVGQMTQNVPLWLGLNTRNVMMDRMLSGEPMP
jgi:RHS repeat-associated protein